MTTQTVNIDAFGYTGTFGAKLRDPDTIATLVATADTVAASGTIASRFVCTFGEVTVIAAGEYLLEFIVNGVSSILYVTLTGVDGETALARAERSVTLESGVTTQLDSMEAAIALLRVSESRVVERSLSDTNAITFAWPVSGATITATRSIDNAVYGAVQGAIAFLRTESSKHYYTLAFDADDRPTAEGQVRYKFVDGTYTRYVVLRTVNLVTAAQVNAQVLDVLSIDTFGELSAPPAATSSLKDKLVWLFMWARNKATATATERKLYADDTTTIVSTETITDNGTTFTKGEAS
jgi:hypothetical protein